MRWRKFGTLACLLISVNCIFALETQNLNHNEDHAPNSNTVIHHPTASLSIAGDLKDVKLKASIAQLVRALQNPSKASEPERRPKLELEAKKPTVPQLITKHNINVHGANGRKLFHGEQIPEPIIISSQPIKITGANKTGGKRSRSMSSIDNQGVKTIEGVRVPDDEHDKHHTWRNARVIKGFLVPNGRSANPHRKRQVMITDPQAYLAAAAAAQAQGATTIFDTSAIQPPNGQQQASQLAAYSYAHSQPQQIAQASKAHVQEMASSGGSAIYHAQQSQQPVHQYQSATGTNGQTTAFAYAPQQQGQMYVLQDGNTYLQYNSPVTGQNQQLASQLSHSQTQFSSRSGELPSSSQIPQTQGVASQTPTTTSDSQKSQDSQLQQEFSQAQALVQAIQNQQNAQAQQQAQNSNNNQQQDQSFQQTQSQVVQADPAQLIQQAQAQYPGQEVLTSASGTQYIIQSNQQGSAVYQIPNQNTFSERQAAAAAYQNSQNGFFIQPQTYIAGPGGQAFTIPIPVPADQVQQGGAQRREDWINHSKNQQNQRADHRQKSHNNNNKDKNLAKRVMDALQVNKKALERIDTTTAVVPALASTGILLGLSALAAGWYLSKGNREVGIVRRTGKPAAGGSAGQSVLSRSRRDIAVPANNYPQEVDQATFFQSIIQQSLEKTQQQYEDQVEPVYNREAQEPVYNREPEPERERPSKPKYSRNERPSTKPQSRDDDYYSNSKVAKTIQDKSGALTIGSTKNFARVFIPALILGVSVISITALIFGWYITGANREIAFLEPASYSRKKRSLLSPTALSDGWLQRTITAIHGNPYDRMPAPTSKSFLPNPFLDRETSKTSDLEFKISNTGLTGVLAGGAIIAIVALGLANSISEANNRQLKTGRSNPSHFPINNPSNTLKHLRAPRTIDATNYLTEGHPDNPGFLSAILSNIDLTQNNIINKLHDVGSWQESPCAKRIFCDLMSAQDDDTIQVMEKRMATFINMLPESVSKTLSHNFSDVVSSIYKRDCSSFTCGGHHVDSSTIHKPSSPKVNYPR